jgi:hypothetical protein
VPDHVNVHVNVHVHVHVHVIAIALALLLIRIRKIIRVPIIHLITNPFIMFDQPN